MLKDIERTVCSKEEIEEIVERLGKEITNDYKDKNLLVVCILKGSCLFFSDLIRKIDLPLEIDFMAVSSYGSETSSSGRVRIMKDIDKDIQDYDILIIEDILDTGNTLDFLKKHFLNKNARSVSICTFLEKKERNKNIITPEYCGYKIDNGFIVGYGLDYAQKYRNLPFIGILKREIYEK